MRPKPLLLIAALCCFLPLLPSSSSAAILDVPAAYPTIQDAVTAASHGDTIRIAPGTYTGPGNRDITISQTSLLIQSSHPDSSVIIDCAGSESEPHRAFLIEHAQVELIGLTIRNGYLPQVCTGCDFAYGAGILVRDSSALVMRHCAIDSNYAWDRSGGIHCDLSSLTMDSCRVTNNTCVYRWGGGVSLAASAKATITDCVFSDNWSHASAAVHVGSFDSLTLTRCTFQSNHANSGAGCIFVDVYAEVEVTDCWFRGNTANFAAVLGAGSSTIFFSGCLFESNIAQGPGDATASAAPAIGRPIGPDLRYPYFVTSLLRREDEVPSGSRFQPMAEGDGGVIYVGSATMIITNCTFIGNAAAGSGGVIHHFGGESYIDSCLFLDNQALGTESEGGAIEGGGYPIEIHNSTFINNTAGQAGGAIKFNGGTAIVGGCTFAGNRTSGWGGGILAVQGDYAFQDCVFEENRVVDYRGSALYLGLATGSLAKCTLFDNRGGLGGMIALHETSPTITQSLIAYSPDGEGIHFYDTLSFPTLSCTDIYGNAGGDWVDFLAPQADSNGNLSADPLFCDTASGDLSIAYESPCAPTNSTCSLLIGALSPTCPCCRYRGDFNHSSSPLNPHVTVSDLTSLIGYLFRGGDAPPCSDEADVNADAQLTVADLTAFISYLFRGSPAPSACP